MIDYGFGTGVIPGGTPLNAPAYLPFVQLSVDGMDFMSLPEEVREALEARRDQLHTAAEWQNAARELLLRR